MPTFKIAVKDTNKTVINSKTIFISEENYHLENLLHQVTEFIRPTVGLIGDDIDVEGIAETAVKHLGGAVDVALSRSSWYVIVSPVDDNKPPLTSGTKIKY